MRARLDTMIAHARTAQVAWNAAPMTQRLAVLRAFHRAAFEARGETAALIAGETGKPVAEALTAEVATVLEGARFVVDAAARALAPRRTRPRALALWRKRLVEYHEPFGVVAVISPWNYPWLLTAMHVLPALVAGNAVILKPSEYTPRTADLLARLLDEAGLPAHLLQVLHGAGDAGAALVDASIDKVFFTGSGRTGRQIAAACAPRFVPVSLELGGSDAAIVLDDADLDVAASGIVWGRFTNAGQTCAAVKRVIALDVVHDELVERMAARLTRLHLGAVDDAAADVGPMISEAQRDLLDEQLRDAAAFGATVAARRDPPADARNERGGRPFAPLVILTDVTPAMRVWREETFGPVLAVVRAGSVEDAVRLANDSSYGLSASVWTRDAARALAVARRLEVGAVTVNDCVLAAGIPEVAHGGWKASGIGRVHGIVGLHEFTRTRTVVHDRLVKRQSWWFGYGARHAERIDAVLRLTHGRGLRERLSGIPDTLRLLFRPERPL